MAQKKNPLDGWQIAPLEQPGGSPAPSLNGWQVDSSPAPSPPPPVIRGIGAPRLSRADSFMSSTKSDWLGGFDDEIGGTGAAVGNWLGRNAPWTAPVFGVLTGKGVNVKFDKGSGDFWKDYAKERDAEAYYNAEAQKQHPKAYMAGSIVGSLLGGAATGGVGAGTGLANAGRAGLAGALYGGLSGAGHAQPGERLSGLGWGALEGAALGKAAQHGINALANTINPIVPAVIQRLQARGIPLTPGQIMGAGDSFASRLAGGIEDRLAGFPITGDVINTARARGLKGFNRAALDDALGQIGDRLPDNIDVGHEGVTYVRRRLNDAYDAILPRLSATVDQQFMNALDQVGQSMGTLTRDRARQLGRIMQDDVGRHFDHNGNITGQGLKDINSRLGNRIRRFAGSADPDARAIADVLRDVQSNVRSMIIRQNPGDAPALQAIDHGWKRLVVLQNAAKNALDGTISPNQLRTASRIADSSLRKRATAEGSGTMQGLAEDAASVLPSKVPDSGTAGRAAMFGLAGAGAVLNPKALIAGMAAAAPYTRTGGHVMESLLTGRQGPIAQRIGNALREVAPLNVRAAAVAPQAFHPPPPGQVLLGIRNDELTGFQDVPIYGAPGTKLRGDPGVRPVTP